MTFVSGCGVFGGVSVEHPDLNFCGFGEFGNVGWATPRWFRLRDRHPPHLESLLGFPSPDAVPTFEVAHGDPFAVLASAEFQEDFN